MKKMFEEFKKDFGKYDIELEFDWNEYCTLVGQCFDLTPHIF